MSSKIRTLQAQLKFPGSCKKSVSIQKVIKKKKKKKKKKNKKKKKRIRTNVVSWTNNIFTNTHTIRFYSA